MAKSDTQRKIDLTEAKATYRRRRKAVLSLDDLSILYGLTKPAFVNLRKTVEGFPDPSERRGNSFWYPAYEAVSALLTYVERHEKTTKGRAKKFSDLVQPTVNGHAFADEPLTAREQLQAYELRKLLIEEEVAQGVLHRADHCAAVSDRVFSLISSTFGSRLADALDPNGKWDPEVREALDKLGEKLTLQVYEQMKDMLTAGVVEHVDRKSAGPSGAPKPRRRARAAGEARAG
jgi:hypothetical protein